MAQFDSICLKNNQVKEDQAQEEQTQRDQAQRDQALKDLPKYVEANLARKMIMNDQENRTQKPRCWSKDYNILQLCKKSVVLEAFDDNNRKQV